MTRYVVLLRGINVGRAKRVGMASLRQLLTARGYDGVRTHLQSGNVLLDTDRGAAELTADVEAALRGEFGFDVAVVVRTASELAAVLAADPLAGTWTDPARHLVTFLTAEPGPGLVAALPEPGPGDGNYRLLGRELYLWLPDGVLATPVGLWRWDRLLGVSGTARNWNTVSALVERAAG
ncbi:DUF1697 domain-containing protein [Modestobacter sp. DSM 44400]|uniref:DUF1697 domain-containing protein n=1 Tax=Modestobacter sp. DSM 44400 TaxID=1550230 RepID=UPI000B895321|nr:DUF1697 domain-containing protein [Modestobacter sp. DSM 44400]